MKRNIFIVVFAAAITILLIGYYNYDNKDNLRESKNNENLSKEIKEKEVFSAKDSRGKQINLENKPKRIVSIAPSNTEILFAIGLDNEIVGVTDYCDFPKKAKTKEKVGGFYNPSIEKIVSLDPDIVLAVGGIQEKTVKSLEKLDIKVFVVNVKTVDDLIYEIAEIGKLLGKSEEAENLTNSMKNRIKIIEDKIKNIKEEQKPSVFVEIWSNPLMTTGKDSFVNDIVNLAGGKNVMNLKGEFQTVSAEAVIKENPKVILISAHGESNLDYFYKKVEWQTVEAVKNKRIYKINSDAVSRAGPRIIDSVEEIAEILHPNLFLE